MQDIQQYGAWRASVAETLEQYRGWVQAAELLDAAAEQRLARALARVRDDRLSVAFVAEFSRGKSELINAIFFADYGQRIVPSSPGRTTMCPTELAWDPLLPPCIRLLPIETRAQRLATSDYREDPAAWTALPLDLDSPERMIETFRQVSLTRRVDAGEARSYGLYDPEDPDLAGTVGDDGLVEIPQWRHALINFPHPLLKQGLVILDTPGLNAIGTEPELTLNLIPNAHAVLFILAAETGVTKSDIEVWRTHIGAGPGRIVVLNKIDALWDELRTPQENEAAIARQQANAAQLLGLEESQVFPVSAQKGLVGRVTGDMALFEKSRVKLLESALFNELIPARQDILRRQLREDMEAITAGQQALLGTRIRDLVEQLQELQSLRGKNQGVIAHMMRRVEMEKKEFDASLFKLQGTRAVFATLSTELYSSIGMDLVQQQVETVRAAMEGVRFATGMRAPVREFFEQARARLDASSAKIGEIGAMMDTMYRRFSAEHGLALAMPMALSLARYRSEIDAIEAIWQKQSGTATLLITSRGALLERFVDTIAARIKHTFRAANADVEAWLKVIMAPLEAQIRQHREQLRHRQSSIQRIHDATESLEQKIAAFELAQRELEQVKAKLALLSGAVTRVLDAALDAAPAAQAGSPHTLEVA
ncbi:GTPase [Massilia sp. WF1]|uniref:dynamin family protein n=1 Tax=unclassified Massilia TaxID=2609279 RepID=UPI000649A826|nr:MULTISPECIES: dynamin family protein [unclassified Massilia]ALK95413.1 GTPase [Massilia sp. WG5]KLU35703.1 GTPase [Massilia sp. WF1]